MIVSFVIVYDYVTTMSHFRRQFMFAIIINALIKPKRTETYPERDNRSKNEMEKKCQQKRNINRKRELSTHKNNKNKNAIFEYTISLYITYSFVSLLLWLSVVFKWLYDLYVLRVFCFLSLSIHAISLAIVLHVTVLTNREHFFTFHLSCVGSKPFQNTSDLWKWKKQSDKE